MSKTANGSSGRLRCCGPRFESAPERHPDSLTDHRWTSIAGRHGLPGLVQVGDVSPVMLVMMNFHGFCVDIRFERVKAYGKGGTVNAMGESSGVKFSLNFFGVVIGRQQTGAQFFRSQQSGPDDTSGYK